MQSKQNNKANRRRLTSSSWTTYRLPVPVENIIWSCLDFQFLRVSQRTCKAWRTSIQTHKRARLALTEFQVQALASTEYHQWQRIAPHLRKLQIIRECDSSPLLDRLLLAVPETAEIDLDIKCWRNASYLPSFMKNRPNQIVGLKLAPCNAEASMHLEEHLVPLVKKMTNLRSVDLLHCWQSADELHKCLPIGLERLIDPLLVGFQEWSAGILDLFNNKRPALKYLTMGPMCLDLVNNQASFTRWALDIAYFRSALQRFTVPLDKLVLDSYIFSNADITSLQVQCKPKKLILEPKRSEIRFLPRLHGNIGLETLELWHVMEIQVLYEFTWPASLQWITIHFSQMPETFDKRTVRCMAFLAEQWKRLSQLKTIWLSAAWLTPWVYDVVIVDMPSKSIILLPYHSSYNSTELQEKYPIKDLITSAKQSQMLVFAKALFALI